jgi:tryptophan synthase alpha chain
MDRIKHTFDICKAENRKALVMFAVMGNPDLATSEKLIVEITNAGADIIELGVPFSDPMADGPVIQAAGVRALKTGVNLHQIIEAAGRIRQQTEVPMVLFSYYNLMTSYGLEELATDAREAGIDAVLAVDLPMEEAEELRPILDKHGLHLIPLIAPTTPLERAAKILDKATGFAYYITVKGVTGARGELPQDLTERISELRKISPIPVVAGFGISSPEMARTAGEHADGVVVGSALVRITLDNPPAEAIKKGVEFTASLAGALKN